MANAPLTPSQKGQITRLYKAYKEAYTIAENAGKVKRPQLVDVILYELEWVETFRAMRKLIDYLADVDVL